MNIYPREVEAVLLRHACAAPPPVEDLDETCLDHLARFKRPKDYRFVDALPTNNYGKVVKREFREQLQTEAGEQGRAETRPRVRLLLSPQAGSGDPEASRSAAAFAVAMHEHTMRRPFLMKLALYLPNFRDKVTVKELEDLTSLAEELDFDSVWTLDRIVVPEASDRQELQYSFGMIEGFPKALPVSSHGEFLQGWPLIPWLAAKTTKVRIGMSITDTPYRAPGVLAAEIATVDQLSNGRINVGIGSGWMPEEFAAASASHIFPKRHKHVRETIEIMQGIWTNDLFEYHGEFADFDRCGFGAKPVQQPHPPIFFSGLKDPKRSANRIAKYALSGWIGIQDSPDELKQWRSAIQREFEELGSSRSIDDLEICSMIWFVITDAETDQTPLGKGSNLLVGTAAQITDSLKRYKEAGLTMPLLWPPFADVPVAKTLDDLKQLKEEIMPKIDAM